MIQISLGFQLINAGFTLDHAYGPYMLKLEYTDFPESLELTDLMCRIVHEKNAAHTLTMEADESGHTLWKTLELHLLSDTSPDKLVGHTIGIILKALDQKPKVCEYWLSGGKFVKKQAESVQSDVVWEEVDPGITENNWFYAGDILLEEGYNVNIMLNVAGNSPVPIRIRMTGSNIWTNTPLPFMVWTADRSVTYIYNGYANGGKPTIGIWLHGISAIIEHNVNNPYAAPENFHVGYLVAREAAHGALKLYNDPALVNSTADLHYFNNFAEYDAATTLLVPKFNADGQFDGYAASAQAASNGTFTEDAKEEVTIEISNTLGNTIIQATTVGKKTTLTPGFRMKYVDTILTADKVEGQPINTLAYIYPEPILIVEDSEVWSNSATYISPKYATDISGTNFYEVSKEDLSLVIAPGLMSTYKYSYKAEVDSENLLEPLPSISYEDFRRKCDVYVKYANGNTFDTSWRKINKVRTGAVNKAEVVQPSADTVLTSLDINTLIKYNGHPTYGLKIAPQKWTCLFKRTYGKYHGYTINLLIENTWVGHYSDSCIIHILGINGSVDAKILPLTASSNILSNYKVYTVSSGTQYTVYVWNWCDNLNKIVEITPFSVTSLGANILNSSYIDPDFIKSNFFTSSQEDVPEDSNLVSLLPTFGTKNTYSDLMEVGAADKSVVTLGNLSGILKNSVQILRLGSSDSNLKYHKVLSIKKSSLRAGDRGTLLINGKSQFNSLQSSAMYLLNWSCNWYNATTSSMYSCIYAFPKYTSSKFNTDSEFGLGQKTGVFMFADATYVYFVLKLATSDASFEVTKLLGKGTINNSDDEPLSGLNTQVADTSPFLLSDSNKWQDIKIFNVGSVELPDTKNKALCVGDDSKLATMNIEQGTTDGLLACKLNYDLITATNKANSDKYLEIKGSRHRANATYPTTFLKALDLEICHILDYNNLVPITLRTGNIDFTNANHTYFNITNLRNNYSDWSTTVFKAQDIQFKHIDSTKTVPVTISGDVTAKAFYESSDARLKDITPTSLTINEILKIPTVNFTWKDKRDHKKHLGTIALDIQEVVPEIVEEDKNGYLTVEYDKLGVLAIEAIRQLKDTVDKQAKLIEQLQNRVESLENKK